MRYDIMFTHAAWHLILSGPRKNLSAWKDANIMESLFGVGFMGAHADCTPFPCTI